MEQSVHFEGSFGGRPMSCKAGCGVDASSLIGLHADKPIKSVVEMAVPSSIVRVRLIQGKEGRSESSNESEGKRRPDSLTLADRY